MKPSVSHSNPKWADTLKKLLKSAGKKQTAVGFPRGQASTGAKVYKSGASVLQIAVWNNYGAHVKAKNGKALAIPDGKGGFIFVKEVHIPPRPFMQQSVPKVKRGAKELSDQVAAAMRKSKKKLTPEQIDRVLNALGQMAEAQIRETIHSGSFKPNSPITVANKGSSRPLADTKLLQKLVSYVVREKRKR